MCDNNRPNLRTWPARPSREGNRCVRGEWGKHERHHGWGVVVRVQPEISLLFKPNSINGEIKTLLTEQLRSDWHYLHKMTAGLRSNPPKYLFGWTHPPTTQAYYFRACISGNNPPLPDRHEVGKLWVCVDECLTNHSIGSIPCVDFRVKQDRSCWTCLVCYFLRASVFFSNQ